jgi:hypothetical protein
MKMKFDYSLPPYPEGTCPREYVKWDYQCSRPQTYKSKYGRVLIKDPQCGVYIWHENQHGKNKPIYVGESTEIQRRLYIHRGGRLDELDKDPILDPNLVTSTHVFPFMVQRMYDKPEYCDDKNCDCLLRYVVRYFIFSGNSWEIDVVLRDYEHKIMHCLHPHLNKEWQRSRKVLGTNK